MKINYSKLQSQLDQLVANHEEPAELTAVRRLALQKMASLRMPRMTKFDYHDWPIISAENDLLSSRQKEKSSTTDAQVFVTINSKQTVVKMPEALQKQGVIITDLFAALKEFPDLVMKSLLKVIRPDEDLLAAYHAAFLNQGLLIYVPRNIQVTTPIHLTVSHDRLTKGASNFHLLIVAEENSRLQIIDHLSSPSKQDNPLTNFTEIIARANSEVHFSSLDHLAQSAPAYYQYRAAIKDHAKVEWAIGLMNECNTVGEVDSELVGEGAHANSQLIALTADNQQLGINNRVTNRSCHSQGLINQRGVALGNSRLIFNGIGQIIHGAHGSEAEQQNRLLMMSPHATGDANPILLIDENDVEAGHAASVGKINQDQLYYLLSRGIPKHQAQRMVIRGFLSAVITAIPDKDVRQEMVKILEGKLKQNA